ncbi:hypothetical protein [Desulfoplanes sp.]
MKFLKLLVVSVLVIASSGHVFAQSQTRQNIEVLEAAGWTIYDTEEKIINRPQKTWRYRTYNSVLVEKYLNSPIASLFSSIDFLLDGSLSNDEISTYFVSDDGYVGLNITTKDLTTGMVNPEGSRRYLAYIKANDDQLEYLKRICPDREKFGWTGD